MHAGAGGLPLMAVTLGRMESVTAKWREQSCRSVGYSLII